MDKEIEIKVAPFKDGIIEVELYHKPTGYAVRDTGKHKTQLVKRLTKELEAFLEGRDNANE